MAKNFMSSILDELMGRDRDALPDEAPRKLNWDDPDMCPYYLVCFCPHELFVNTKADLGTCSKFHDEQLKKKYADEAPGYKKSVNESEFIRFAEKMIADIEGKIKRGKLRIALANGPDGGTYAGPGSKNAEKIALLTEKINNLLDEAESAGCEGNVEKAQGLMKLCDQLKEEKEQLKSNEVSHPWNPDKAMQVCEVCGSYLIIGEAQHRLDDHIMGKQHVGFAMLRKNLDDVKKAKEKRDVEEREKMEKEREKRWASRNTDREPLSGGSRDRRRDSASEKPRGERERTRDRDRSGRDGDRDRRKRRSNSRDRKRDSEKRGKSAETEKNSKSPEKVKDEEKEKDKDRHRRDKDRGHERRSRDHRKRSSSRDRDSKHRRSSDDSKRSRDKRSHSKGRSRSRSRDRKDKDRRHSHKRSRSDRERNDERKDSNSEKPSFPDTLEKATDEECNDGPSSSKLSKLELDNPENHQDGTSDFVDSKPDSSHAQNSDEPERGLFSELETLPDPSLRLYLEDSLGK